MHDALKKITARAKALRRGNKNLSWRDAIKRASLEYNKGARPVAKVKKAKKAKRSQAPAKRKVSHVATGSHGLRLGERNRIEGEIKAQLRIIEDLKKSYKATRDKSILKKIRLHKKYIPQLKRSLRESNSLISRLLS